MKKTMCLVVTAAIALGLLGGCAGGGDEFEAKTYASGETPVSGVQIDVRDREIAVSLSSDGQVHLDYFESEKEGYDVAVSEEGVLTMAAASRKEWTDYIGAKASAGVRKISLQIPDALLSALELSTTNAGLSLPALTVTDHISLFNNGGKITFDTLDPGNALTVENKNAAISGAVAGSPEDYAISCTIKKGESDLPSAGGGGNRTLSVTNNNGDIEIEFVDK